MEQKSLRCKASIPHKCVHYNHVFTVYTFHLVDGLKNEMHQNWFSLNIDETAVPVGFMPSIDSILAGNSVHRS